MLRITIELISGVTGKVSHLGTATIINDGTGSKARGNYKIVLSKWGTPNTAWKRGEVKDFPREQRGPWDLLYQALATTVGKRNQL